MSINKLLVVIPILTLLGLGCSNTVPAERTSSNYSLTVRDDLGHEVTMNSVPSRVISLSPEATELVYALDAGDTLVAVVTECDYPPAAKELPKVGSFSTPSFEAILGYAPDLVLATGHEQESFVKILEDNKVPVMAIYPQTLADVQKDMRLLGEVFNKKDKGEELASDLIRSVEDVKKAVVGFPRPRVYVEIADQPLMTASEGSMVAEMMEIAGGDNVAKGLPRAYCRIEPEVVLAADPEVIVLAHTASNTATVSARPGWSNMSAVRKDRIISDIDPSLIFRAGPRLGDGLWALACAFHPEIIPPRAK